VASYRPRPTTPALGDTFFDRVEAARFPETTLRFRNQRAADALGLGALDDAAWLSHFARFAPLPENLLGPLALRYHGHQFQQYNPRIGDGRGFLYAQALDEHDRLIDLSTKGSGKTPWSRDGDGRLTLKGGVREVLATEMLEALGVLTSRSLSLVETGEQLQRGDEPSPTRSSVLVRAMWSSVRFGTFQRLAYEGDKAATTRLVDFTIENYFPRLGSPEALFRDIAQRSAKLVGQWTAAGFVHGVLNSDNLNVTGESFDYGPWRFLPHYDPGFTAAYFDSSGLYAFGRQPAAVRWNLERLAESLSAVASRGALERALVDYEARVLGALTDGILWRLNLESRAPADDALFVQRVLCWLGEGKDQRPAWDRFFFDWEGGDVAAPRAMTSLQRALYETPRFAQLRASWANRAPRNLRRLDSPYLRQSEPTTMIIDEVERIWSAIAERDDWRPFHDHIAAVRRLGEHYGL
jgi:serine/tyrosine/threonine adenylyltransferase